MHLSVMVRASIVAAALACAALIVLPARAQEAPRPMLSLTGHGEVSVAPDMAIVNSGVVTEANTAREALDSNNAAIADVIAAFKDAGIEAKDIQTSGFRVQPRYQRKPDAKDDQGPQIVGYSVSNSVTVTVRDLAKLGPVLDKAVSVGANRISGISFDVSDADKHLDEARTLAMKDAIRKAEIYAAAAGVELGPIQSISEAGGFRPVARPEAMMMRADAAPSVPVEAGEQSLSIDVNVTWELTQ